MAVVIRKRSALSGSFVIAALSGIVLAIHAAFGLVGWSQIHWPVSIACIVGTIGASPWQASLTWPVRSECSLGS
jgi:hypothetical protein